MNCRKCGARLTGIENFCPRCGQPTREDVHRPEPEQLVWGGVPENREGGNESGAAPVRTEPDKDPAIKKDDSKEGQKEITFALIAIIGFILFMYFFV